MNTRSVAKTIAIAVVLLFTKPLLADKIEEILAKVDRNLTEVKDSIYQGELKVIRNGEATKTIKFNVKLKGLTMKLVRFTAPGDVRGMAVLTTREGHMYVYLPSYKRVRRIASHVRNQGFMGTDISPEDFGAASFSKGWHVSMNSEDDEKWILTVKPEKKGTYSYDKLRLTVLKKYGGVSKIEYFSAKGKHIKTQERTEWKSFGPVTLPSLFTVTDLQTGSTTTLRFLDVKVNQGIRDSAFSKRAILRAD